MKRNLSLLLPVLALLLLMTGCSTDDATPTSAGLSGSDDYAQIDFNQEFGGLTATDENAAFSDPTLEAMLLAEEGAAVDDPLADDPAVRALEDLNRRAATLPDSVRPRFTFVRLRWGMLRSAADTVEIMPPCEAIDWTGQVYTDFGSVVVRRLIAFERPQDHVIWPRLNRQTVGLVSHTACGFDGIVLQIMEHGYEASPSLTPVRNQLHIELGPYSAVFNVDELGGLHEVVEVDDLGNGFEVTGFTSGDVDVCPRGFLSGVWRPLPTSGAVDLPDSNRRNHLGNFTGAWFTLHGRVHGFLRGGYGVDAGGNRVFVGKYIGPRGGFRGFLRGTWEPGDTAADLATFLGHWHDARGRAEGLLGGEAHRVGDSPGGFFVGRWTALCDPEAEEVVN